MEDGVAGHLGIDLAEYDERIRTFVPHYETLVSVVAGALELLDADAPTIVDLGIGTGAVSRACLAVRPRARIVGIDADGGMLEAAGVRLRAHAALDLVHGSFLDVELPAADAMVACISLHHIPRPEQKQAFYRRVYGALRPGGIIVSGDCFPAVLPALAERQRAAWLRHLERSYTAREANDHLDSWAGEDTYFPLNSEVRWLSDAGFAAEVLWRADGFAVVAGIRTD